MRVLLLVVGFVLLASNAGALTVIVPDSRTTIQAAINGGADSVLVRGGYYPEVLEIRRSVTILQYPAPSGYGYSDVALPRVRGLTIKESYPGQSTTIIRGVRFTGPVILDRENHSSMYLTFESCRLDSGLNDLAHSSGYLGIQVLNVQGCTILQGAKVRPYASNFTLNTFIGGGLEVFGEGFSTVRGNYVQGPAEVGIRSRGESPIVEDNTVVGTVVGIDVSWHTSRNEVSDCSGIGIRGVAGGGFFENVVRRCGGNGIEVYAAGNQTDISRNLIVGAGGTGIQVTYGYGNATITENVVAHCGGPGVTTEGGIYARANTCYQNQGSAFVTPHGTLEGNIAFANGGYALEWSEYEPHLKCNDWFGNLRGSVAGRVRNEGHPGPTDLAVDPLFCDINSGDVHLRADSPLLNSPGCGLIGALGQGCEAVVSVTDEASVEAPILRATPLPSADGVQLSWRPLAAPGRLEVFDALGARRWRRDLSAGETGMHWSGTDASGQRLPSGVYFVRLIGAGAVTSTRVVLTR